MQILSMTKQIESDMLKNFRALLQTTQGTASIKLTDLMTPKRPQITFTQEAINKMWALVDHCPKEIGWHGLINRDGKNFKIYDIIVYPQTTTGTSIDCDPTEFANWISEYITRPDDTFEHIRMHGHSHVNMNVFSSGIDDKYQKDLLTKVEKDDYYLFLICNKQHKICVFLYDYTDNILYETDDVDLIFPEDQAKQWANKQITTYVKEAIKTYATATITRKQMLRSEYVPTEESKEYRARISEYLRGVSF